jgi:inhibitor of KinA
MLEFFGRGPGNTFLHKKGFPGKLFKNRQIGGTAKVAGLFEKALIKPVGDRGLLAEYGDAIAPDINRKVRAMALALEQERPAGMVEVIPTYRSLLIVYDPMKTDVVALEQALDDLEGRLDHIRIPSPRTVEVPVLYGGECGPDIEFVAQHAGLSADDVIRIHSGTPYQIYMMGFTPGFAYLGGLPEAIHAPRLETPRVLVPAGSVGIANNQTGIYPVPSPAGWRIIGRVPLKLFDPLKSEPFLYRAGDFIKFNSISESEYNRLAGSGGV